MMNLIKLKRSTASDTGTAKNNARWLRIGSERSEIDHLLDLYWGGEERRITGMTLRIIKVNLIALVTLLLGVIYLGQYHQNLVASKLERFETEILLVNAAFIEGSEWFHTKKGYTPTDFQNFARELSLRFGLTLDKRIVIFNQDNKLVWDTAKERADQPQNHIFSGYQEQQPKRQLQSVLMLKGMASWIVSLLPRKSTLTEFPGVKSENALDYSDVKNALENNLSISAWEGDDGEVVLTAAMPILDGAGGYSGALLLVSESEGIREELATVWFSIVNIFLLTLFITILLSIYLSGVIARPLRKLAQAAEDVRKGRATYDDIPDMRDRHDEIGELSYVLRDMTYALWERMDAIESFAADVSHEIKNPLTSLKSAVETASIVKKESDREKLLDVIRQDIDRLDRLISDISSISRLDSALSREQFGTVDVKYMLRQVMDLYLKPLERKEQSTQDQMQTDHEGVCLRLEMSEGQDMFMRGSEGRLIQVFHNLVSNALSFAPQGSEVRVVAELSENRITITVEDEGRGIPESKLLDVFERFYSERPEHEEYGRHSGLGLSICKKIVTAHNGVIFAENKLAEDGTRKGARFVVIFNRIEIE